MSGARAEETNAAQPAGAQAGAAAASDCSGIMCLFSSRTRGSQASVSPHPQVEADPAPQETSKPAPASVRKAERSSPAVLRPVTIAAAPTEMERLKVMAGALPKTKVHFVAPSAARKADLVVLTTGADDGDRQVRLFTEQVHVVATGPIHSFADLRDKTVSFGPAGAPTEAAARKIFAALDIPVRETPLDLDNALDGLATGDIDAVVVLAPEPSKALNALQGAGLHLLSWPEGAAPPSGAAVTAIDGKDYPHLAASGERIRTIGVDAVLQPTKASLRQPGVKHFLAALTQHSAELSKLGFDRLRADLRDRSARQVASVERR